MYPASKSKPNEKKAGKDAQKASSKPSTSVSANNHVPASAYNPLLGTFQVLDSVPSSSASPLHNNGRFRNMDEGDVTAVESDSISNNGSWSGESEDHKEKTSNPPARPEAIPGADADKREKIRQKNERKHQRQKEKRAQELHERCSGYLMSRKLEALAQQLVAMGISHEQATMSLILNEGKVEESVHWLFDRGEEEVDNQSAMTPGNLKIDITEELARMTDMEMRYKSTKQEVERAVVAAEGDLDKADETLRAHKQESISSAPSKPEESNHHLIANNGRLTVGTANQNSTAWLQPNPTPLPALQQMRDGKNFNYTRTPSVMGASSDPVNKMVQPVKRVLPKLDWEKPQQNASLVDNGWPSTGSNPSVSYSLASPLQASPSPTKLEARCVSGGNEFKNLQQPLTREPITMIQRTQVVKAKQVPAVKSINSSLPGTSAGWYPATTVEIMKSNGFMMPHIPSTGSPSSNKLSSNQVYQQLQYQQQQRFSTDSSGISHDNGLWSRRAASPTVAAASSLGLFSGLGSTGFSGPSSPVDWSTGGSMGHLDYSSIDWSLDRGLSSSLLRPNGLWLGSASSLKSTHMYDSNINGFGLKSSMGLGVANSTGTPVVNLQNRGAGVVTAESSTATSADWTSPFEGKDLFSLPRQFVSSPSL